MADEIRLLELFGGIGACTKAFERLGIPHKVVDYVEIDKYAVKSYNAIHGTYFEPQDIRRWDKDIEVDLIMHGSPCQDFSLAGLQRGGDEGSGTRSSLMYETVRIVNNLNPKYVIWENVKNLVSEKHIHNFYNYIARMRELGYKSYWQVLNSKDYGIPQNRERVFTISIREDLKQIFEFPKPIPLKLRLKDMLEDEVDEKYYLSEKMLNYCLAASQEQQEAGVGEMQYMETGREMSGWEKASLAGVINPEIAQTLGVRSAGGDQRVGVSNFVTGKDDPVIPIKNATKQGYLLAKEGDGIDISGRMESHRGTVQDGLAQTVNTNCDGGVVVSE